MDFPPMAARALPGNLEDAYRAGITPRILGGTIEDSTLGCAASRPSKTARACLATHRLPAYDLEFLHAPAAIFIDIDVALRIDGDPVRLIELAREMSVAAEAAQNLPS